MGLKRLPEICDLVTTNPAQVDQSGMALGPPANRSAITAFKINGDGLFHQTPLRATPQTQLRQSVTRTHKDREGARADLQPERATIAFRHIIKRGAGIGHYTREDINAPG